MNRIQEAIYRIEITKNLGRNNLNLSNLGLTQIPNSLQLLKNQLVNIDLSGNELNSIPDYFSEFTKLQHIHLSNNKFTKFPVILLKVKELKHLCIRENFIQIVPDEIINIDRHIDLQLNGNLIKNFPITLANAEMLITVSISDNPIENIPLDVIEKELDLLFYLYEKDKGDKFKIPIDPRLRTAFKQYLVHFNEFVRQTKGKNIHFEIRNYEKGLELEIKVDNKDQLINIEKYLEEYVDYLKQNHEDLNIIYELKISKEQDEFIKLQLKNEVQQFKLKFDFANFKVNYLEKEINRLNENLTLALQQPKNISISQNSYIQNNRFEKLNTELDLFKSYLEELLGKELNEIEVEKVLEIQNELSDLKQGSETNIKKSSIWEKTKNLTSEILKRCESLGKGMKGIKDTIDSSQVITKQIDYILEILNNIT